MVWELVAVLGVVVGALAAHRLLTGEVRDTFAESLAVASRELAVRFEPRSRVSSARGVVDDFQVSVELVTAREETEVGPGDSLPYLEVSVTGDRIPRGLTFAEERGTGEDVLTGDAVFDDIVEIHGQPGIVLALMTRDLRQRVAVFVRGGGWLERGRLTSRSRAIASEWEIPSRLRMIVRLARDLASAEGGGICERLARNALADPMPGVRLWNLQQLQDEFPGRPQSRDASRAALRDSSPWVRLTAARMQREEGLPVLEELVRDRKTPDQAALEAVSLLAARLPPARAGALLLEVLKTRSGAARRQAVEELGRLRHALALGPLIVLTERGDAEVATAAATALGLLGDARAETCLITALNSAALELRLAAAWALAKMGTVRSVEPLLAQLEKRGLDATSRQRLRTAVASVQSRLVGAGAGQLSLAPAAAQAGRLSLASPRAGSGDLSFPTDD